MDQHLKRELCPIFMHEFITCRKPKFTHSYTVSGSAKKLPLSLMSDILPQVEYTNMPAYY